MTKLKRFLDDDRTYFKTCGDLIASHNGDMLNSGCVAYAAVLTFYTAFTALTDQPDLLRYMYYAFDLFHLVFCALVIMLPKRRKTGVSLQVLCLALELSVLGFFALEGAYISATQHSLYVPIAILLVQLLFIHRSATAIIMNVVYALSYAVMCVNYKTPEAYVNDVYIAVATFISSCLGYYLIAGTRHGEGAAMRKYEALSKMDSTTGLYNKEWFEKRCQSALGDGAANAALIIFDVDGFRLINDSYGYEVGDEVLRGLGFAVRKTFRESDILSRFNGDKFVVLMRPCPGKRSVAELVERFLSQAHNLNFSAAPLTVNCRGGIALGRADDDMHALFLRAQRALESAKSAAQEAYMFSEE